MTRTLPPPAEATSGEQLLDIALPERSLLVAVEVRDRGRWRSIDAADPARVGRRSIATRARPAA